MTGTVLSGTVEVNSNVEIASLKEIRKVKSIQIFRKSANFASQGDRAGICVTQFDSSLLERGLVSQPGVLPSTLAVIVQLEKIRFYKGDIISGNKYHIRYDFTQSVSQICQMSQKTQCHKSQFRVRFTVFR